MRRPARGGLPEGAPPGSSPEPPRSERPRNAVAPSHRPPWLVVLSSLTLIYGGLLLVSGLSALRDPMSAARIPTPEVTSPAEQTFAKRLVEANTRVIDHHRGALRALGGASLGMALVMLYAAAAALSRDRRGRTVNLTAAWLGIAYQLAGLPVMIPIAREYAQVSTPLLIEKMAADRGTKVDTTTPPQTVAAVAQSFVVGVPVVTSAIGVAGSLLMIAFFGGRRGRVLYGLEPPRPAPPGRGRR